MRAYVGSFSARSGTGIQDIIDVMGRDGVEFIPIFILFQSGYAVLNTITAGDNPLDAYADFHGADDLVSPVAQARADTLGAGVAKFTSGYETPSGGNQGSLIDHDASAAFGGVLFRLATVTSAVLGGYRLTYTVNGRTGDDVIFTAFGADDDDLTIEHTSGATNGTITTTKKPQGLLAMSRSFTGPSGWGWNTRDGDIGSSVVLVANQGGNGRYQRTTTFGAWLEATLGVVGVAAGNPVVSSWDDLAYTISGCAVLQPYQQYAFCGDLIKTVAVPFIQSGPTQRIDLGIDAKWVKIISVGAAPNSSLDDTVAELTIGWTDGTRQVGYWSAENTVGNVGSVNGARYIHDDALLRFATPAGLLTTFDAVVELSSLDPRGFITLNWPTDDAAGRQLLLFAVGEAIAPPERLSGIYRMIPDKLNDTVYLDADLETTVDVKIPDPSITTSLLGDE